MVFSAKFRKAVNVSKCIFKAGVCVDLGGGRPRDLSESYCHDRDKSKHSPLF